MSAERCMFLVLLAWLGLHTCGAEPVHAQADDRFALTLVVVTAHEAGLDSLADCDGIHATLVHGAERHGMTPTAFARAYSRRLFHGATRRPWVLGIRLNCARPRGFVGRWNEPRAGGARSGTVSRRDACLALVAHARELVAGEPRCEADDWAARWHPLDAWLVAVDCGDTRNRFARRVRQ